MNKTEEISSVLTRGRHLVHQATLVSDDVSEIDDLLTSAERRWTDLRKDTCESASRLAEALPLAECFNTGLLNLLAWLDLTEDRFKWQSQTTDDSSSSMEVDRIPIAVRLTNVQSLSGEVRRQHQDVESLCDLSRAFLQLCDISKESVQQRMDSLESRWSQLDNGMF